MQKLRNRFRTFPPFYLSFYLSFLLPNENCVVLLQAKIDEIQTKLYYILISYILTSPPNRRRRQRLRS